MLHFQNYPKIIMNNNEKNELTRILGNEALRRGIDIKVKRHV